VALTLVVRACVERQSTNGAVLVFVQSATCTAADQKKPKKRSKRLTRLREVTYEGALILPIQCKNNPPPILLFLIRAG
jgi:hypothetical protein